ncbi:MAG: 50S ribosomal protein L10 [Patescibacteria group bacterium]
MPKSREQKQTTLKLLASWLKDAKSIVFANFQGLKVSEATVLRRECRKQNIKVLATKKTLLKKACEELGLNIEPEKFSGGVAVFMGVEDEVAPAKTVANFAKTHEIVSIFGGMLEGKMVDASVVKSLASLPSKEALLAKMVGALNAPISGFVNALSGNLRNLVGVLNNIKEAKV